ncbi:MAG: O-antigen ligase family protein [Alphaproteobacteria bacterium]|nr:O-antigen ligase family protein [Alphaproteobacteria bacterium]NNF24954.1 O-antigen ligase family protein [Paracoccaceae bacterium]
MTATGDISDAPARRSIGASRAKSGNNGLLLLFFVALLIPAYVEIAGLRLSPLRVYLLVAMIPLTIQVLRGAAGRVTGVDIFMLLHAFWIVIALVVVHGTERILFAGITMVELVGGYFVGRSLIRNAQTYKRFTMILLGTLVVLFPLALVEHLTGRILLAEVIGKFAGTIFRADSAYSRMGLERVYAAFEHPILYGLYCSVAIANLYYIAKRGSFWRLIAMGFAVFMTFMSLSSAPLISCGLQFGLILWDRIMKGRWTLFIVLAVTGYVVIDALSNRTPVTIMIETLTFNPATGWTRIAIFDAGIAAAISNPIFGIGFNDWPRPHWVTSSVDNFWLLTTMRYGFVGSGLIVLAFLSHFWLAMRTPVHDEQIKRLRTGHLIALTAVCFTIVTVHIWGAVGVFVMFYLGAGSWIYTGGADAPPPDAAPDGTTPDDGAPKATRYSRFAPKKREAKAMRPKPAMRRQLRTSRLRSAGTATRSR